MEEREAFGNWLTGFTDAEGCFGISRGKAGCYHTDGAWIPEFSFSIQLREDDGEILERICDFLGCGSVCGGSRALARSRGQVNARDQRRLKVTAIDDLLGKVVPHFERHPLLSKKRMIFDLWRRGLELQRRGIQARGSKSRPVYTCPESVRCRGEIYEIHTEMERLRDDVSVVGSAVGLPTLNSEAFGHWISGFTDGDGSFGIYCYDGAHLNGGCLTFAFEINLREDDASVLNAVADRLAMKTAFPVSREFAGINANDQAKILCRDVDQLAQCVVPHFEAFPLRAKKQHDFDLWREALEMQVKAFALRGGKYNTRTNPPAAVGLRKRILGLASLMRKGRNPGLQKSRRTPIPVLSEM